MLEMEASMLTQTKTDSSNKIAMGLLSYSAACQSTQDILDTLQWYDQEDCRRLYLYKEDKASDYIGLLGIEETEDELILIRVATLNPSYRNEGYLLKMIDDLQDLYHQQIITSTLETKDFVLEWHQSRVSNG